MKARPKMLTIVCTELDHTNFSTHRKLTEMVIDTRWRTRFVYAARLLFRPKHHWPVMRFTIKLSNEPTGRAEELMQP